MKRKNCVLIILILFFTVTLHSQTDYMKQWPQFRGPFASGIMEDAELPDTWDIQSGENILWKTSIPGLGHSCPIVWEDLLFVSTAISGNRLYFRTQKHLIAVGKADK